MSLFLKIYTLLWISACVVSAILVAREKSLYVFLDKSYWKFLFKPWKVVTFIIGAFGLTAIAPYTGDYTWDYYDTALMSALTFVTAPWAVGIFYKFRKGQARFRQAFVAFCLWMLSVSWSYDIYMYFREGVYPPTWLPNIGLSSFLYAYAGFMWNLDWKKEKGIFFSFKEGNWPAASEGRVFPKLFIATVPFILGVIILAGLVIYGIHSTK
ncbi:MAG: hypothetical protein FJZ09_05720 [Candidatus Omnitrophica bacterium]|nr:hypothetical protein [Candidatus Omnitrophota bacterium]